MAQIVKLTTDGRGNFQRDIGWKLSGSGKPVQHRFYFGVKPAPAQIRCLQVLECWDAVESRWSKMFPATRPERPLWDKLTLDIAKAVAAGQEELSIDPSEYITHQSVPVGEPYEVDGVEGLVQDYHVDGAALSDPAMLLRWFNQLAKDFPMIRLRQAGTWPQEARANVKATAARHRQAATAAERLTVDGQTLHQALDAFHDWYGEHYRTLAGTPTEHAVVCQHQIKTIRQHAKNVHLEAFNLNEVEGIIRYWSQRPVSKRGTPVKAATARNHVKRLRHFIRWLHKNPAFDWRKPEDYEVEYVRIPVTVQEKAKRFGATQVATYSVEELTTIWKYATQRERVLITLALNCGFGAREIGTLQLDALFLNQPHGYYPNFSGSFIKYARSKTDVYGEWRLWPETEQAMDWYLAQRPQTTETALLVTAAGKNLVMPTKGNNRNGRIPNVWSTLLKRIEKDVPGFRRLSFNKLRKTGASLVREVGGGEISGIYLCHGQSVKSDSLAEVYTNRPFDKVFSALDTVRSEKLAPVFAAIADPFPGGVQHRNPSIPLSVRERIVELRRKERATKRLRLPVASVLTQSDDMRPKPA